MAEVDINKIKTIGFERAKLPDGSARFLRYKTDEEKKELLTLKHWHGSNYLPNQRVVDAVISIVKSSANCYKLVYSDSQNTEFKTFQTLGELNDYLFNLNQLKIDLPKAQKK